LEVKVILVDLPGRWHRDNPMADVDEDYKTRPTPAQMLDIADRTLVQ
jgi:hypothetical protein